MPRILITDTSSSFGQAIARQFLDRGWEVIATMRNPSTESLPGIAPETSFGRNAVARMGTDVPEAYGHFVQAYLQSLQSATEKTQARDVAQTVWRAVTDESSPMKLPAGADADAETCSTKKASPPPDLRGTAEVSCPQLQNEANR